MNTVFINNIIKTIGAKHEVHCIENYNEFSLTSVYNDAIKKYNNDKSVFVFCHPDIVFKTMNWGRILLSKFNSSDFSIIGLAGSTSMPESGIWWENKNTIHGIVEHTDGINTWISNFSSPIKNIQEVVVIDGVFMAIDCNNIVNLFDESFNTYHHYDTSITASNYLDGVNIGVITTIRILHKSVGQTSPDWERNRQLFVEKYKEHLPMSIPPICDEINIIPKENDPKVTVIIPTKNNFEILFSNIKSWHEYVRYKNYSIIIADTGSSEDVLAKYDQIISENISIVKYDYYNFAKINNDVVNNHVNDDTEILLFCNDDIELLNDALSRCVEIYRSDKHNTGTIGIRLHYENSSVQHCGIDAHIKANRLHLSHIDLNKTNDYSIHVNYKSIGNTGAFLMINKNLFSFLGQFNENYIECFEDVELNFKCLINDLKNITVNDAVAYHLESVTRNKNENKLKNLNKDYFDLMVPFYEKNRSKLDQFIN
jgi:GT2 family glycosyltransferase